MITYNFTLSFRVLNPEVNQTEPGMKYLCRYKESEDIKGTCSKERDTLSTPFSVLGV